jgi:lysophospholipase L1-like esterase
VTGRIVLRRAWAAALGVVVALLALEAIVRTADPRALMAPWQDDIRGVTVPKAEMAGRFAIPNRFDTTFTLHARFRSLRPVALDPSPGCQRIAVLGDSATFGWGAEDDETYPAVLDRLLRSRLRAAHSPGDVEVLNAGVIGTGTGEQALWYDLWVRQYRPSVTLLTVFWNDVDDDLVGGFFVRSGSDVAPTPLEVLDRGLSAIRRTRRVANAVPGFAWASQHSHLLAWIRQRPTTFFESAHARAVGAPAESRLRSDSAARFRLEGLPLFEGEVAWLRDRVKANGSQLAVVFLPSAEAIEPGWPQAVEVRQKSALITSALAQMSSRNQIPFADLTPAIQRRSLHERLYFAKDPHPNPSGYRAIADAAATFLIQRGLVR